MKKLLILCAILSLLSCGSRKKALNKSSEKTKTETAKEIDSVVQNDVQKTETKEVKEITTNKETTTDFEGMVKDSINEASVNTKQETDGSVTRTYKGFKSIKESASSKDQISDIEITDSSSNIDRSTIDLSTKEQYKEQSESDSKVLNVERESSNSWVLYLIIVLAIIGATAYWYFTKTNPIAGLIQRLKQWMA